MRLKTLAVFATMLGIGTLPLRAAEFRAGAAKSCITLPLGTRINGGVGPGVARHIHGDLFVRALVLDDGATRLAFAVVDTCLLDRPVFDEAKKARATLHGSCAGERADVLHAHALGRLGLWRASHRGR